MDSLSDGLRRVTHQIRAAASETNSSKPPDAAPPPCPHCRGAGFLRRDLPPGHAEFGRAVVCECQRANFEAQRREQLYRTSNLRGLARHTFEAFEPRGYGLDTNRQKNLQRAYEICHNYAEAPEGWLVLTGGYGCGKTHLSVAIANHQIEAGRQPLFVVVPDLLDHLRATYGPHSAVPYDERFNQIRNAELLLLDDLGTQNATPWAQEKLFQLINHRYNSRLPTIITTNQPFEEIDIRIRSRMVDPEITQLIKILAPDFRQSGVDQESSDLSALSLLSHMTFENFDLRGLEISDVEAERLRQAYNSCRHFAEGPEGWLVLVGDYGVGKTHLSAAIANTQQARGQQTLFIVVPDLLDHLRATYNPSSNIPYDKRFDQIRRSPLLVLDDLGTQSASAWAQEKLFQLFNYRYMARLPTVVTLNDIDQVEPRLLERMMEMKAVGHGSMLELRVAPYRGRGNRRARPAAESPPAAPRYTRRRRTGR